MTEEDELFIMALEESSGDKSICMLQLDLTSAQFNTKFNKLKSVIQERTRDMLTLSSLAAAKTMSTLLTADADTDKAEIKLRAAGEILDRSGITKHTNIDVKVESENGLFILPAKDNGEH